MTNVFEEQVDGDTIGVGSVEGSTDGSIEGSVVGSVVGSVGSTGASELDGSGVLLGMTLGGTTEVDGLVDA